MKELISKIIECSTEPYLKMKEFVGSNSEIFVIIGIILTLLGIFVPIILRWIDNKKDKRKEDKKIKRKYITDKIRVFRKYYIVIRKKLSSLVPEDILSFRWGKRKYYTVIWKKSSSLVPEDILGFRGKEQFGFSEYYRNRYHDQIIKPNIEKGENILIIGNPLSGKTRAVYEALKKLEEPVDVIIPRIVDINPEDFRIPRRFLSRRKKLLILDDIDKYSEKNNFILLLNEFDREKVVIVATCRSGQPFDIFRSKMERENYPSFNVQAEIKKVSNKEGEEFAKKIIRKLPPTFDGNIGSIFLPLETMKKRFKESTDEEKCVLRSIRILYFSGIYEGKETFSIDRIKKVCEDREEIEKRKHEWYSLFNRLKNNGFIEIYGNEIQIEKAYLYSVIDDGSFSRENLRDMLNIFLGDPDALYSLGTKAYNIGEISLERESLMKIAIEACKGTLKIWTKRTNPFKYGRVKNSLGNAYKSLSEIKDKPNNVKLAIQAYNYALKIRNFDRFPTDYATTQNNLGNAYSTLSEVVDTEINSKLAIKAFNKALKVRTLNHFPIQYASTQNNLGVAYVTLSVIVDKEKNAKLAIEAYNEALKIYTLDRFPIQYAMTQNNLGIAYMTLSEVVDREKNAKLAIKAYNEALKVRTLERIPIDYAGTQLNIGILYGSLAESGNKTENCRRAREAYDEAMRVFIKAKAPVMIQKIERNIEILDKICKEE